MAEQSKATAAANSNRTTVIAIVSISIAFVGFVAIVWRAGFFSFTGSDPSSKIVAAALALVGGLVTAVVSIVGVVLKYAIDQRTESRLQIESDRASALQTQAEQRLNLEAAIRAVELLGSDASAGGLQRVGALYALASLNQNELTLDLTSYLLARRGLEPNVACTLIDRALKSSDLDIQREAVNILFENADRMVTQSNAYLPHVISMWDKRLSSVYVREWAVLATARILLARQLPSWTRDFMPDANGIIASLALAWEFESDPVRKEDAAAIVHEVLEAFPAIAPSLNHPTKTIDIQNLRTSVAGKVAFSSVAKLIVQELQTWRTVPKS
jgi:hypothetical protein